MSAAATIHVCPLSRLADTLAATGAGTVVSLLTGASTSPPTLAGCRHVVLDVADIVEARPGLELAQDRHVSALLAAGAAWDRRAPLLVHCYAGVSRSPAAAFVLACALSPRRDEREIARALRAASPSATPNARLVALADAMLGRDGRMIAAVAAIGRGRDCFEGEVFGLALPDAEGAVAAPPPTAGPDQMPAHQA